MCVVVVVVMGIVWYYQFFICIFQMPILGTIVFNFQFYMIFILWELKIKYIAKMLNQIASYDFHLFQILSFQSCFESTNISAFKNVKLNYKLWKFFLLLQRLTPQFGGWIWIQSQNFSFENLKSFNSIFFFVWPIQN